MNIEVLTKKKSILVPSVIAASCTPDFPDDEVCGPDEEWGCGPEWPYEDD